MNFLFTGGSGFIGKAIEEVLLKKNHHVKHLTRDDFKKDTAYISDRVEWSDVIINLAGANISKKWSNKYKKEIYDSRIETTKLVIEAISRVKNKPNILISASAVGFYDNSKVYDEEHFLPTDNFLGDLCSDWETIAMRASKHTRVVVFRFGVVLGNKGGLIKKMMPAFKLGLGAVIGSGNQAMTWIHLSDVLNAVQFAMKNKKINGIYNLCSPIFTTQKEFSTVFARALKRPLIFKIPSFILKLILGEGAIIVLDGQRVKPSRLIEEGFNFRFLEISSAVNDIVGVSKNE